VLRLTDGTEVSCRALVIASGVQYRKLDAPGLQELEGAGVFYGAAITEARGTAEKDIFIVGGGNSAGQAAMYLSRFARSVTILIRGTSLSATMSQYLIDRITETEHIDVQPFTQVAGAHGDGHLERLTLLDSRSGQTQEVPAGGLFIFIGAVPLTEWVEGKVQRDARGFIPTGAEVMVDGKRPRGWWADRDPFWLESSAPGVFVAGDVRSRSIKRVASAVGEGSMAVSFIHQHLSGL
jgi:thioredoxin reductase (NADPH)